MSFDAFISYSHEADSKLATALESSLEKIAKPVFARRAMNVFRDVTSLSLAPHLWTTIQDALVASRHLVYLASPQAAESHWVGKELEYWLGARDLDSLLIVLTDGELIWDEKLGDFDWTETTSLPRTLAGKFQGEPLYLDLRWFRSSIDSTATTNRLQESAMRVVAAIRKREVADIYGEDLKQHRRLLAIRNGAIMVLLTLIVILGGTLFVVWKQQAQVLASRAAAEKQRSIAEQQRNEAIQQKAIAEQQTIEAVKARTQADEQRARADAARAVAQEQAQFVTRTLNERLSMDRVSKDGYFKVMEVFPRGNDARLTPDVVRALDGMVRLLTAYSNGTIRVAGNFQQAGGGPEYAMVAGERQAQAIQQYLVQRGIPAARIEVRSLGQSSPLLPMDNPEAAINEITRQINGRTEVSIKLASLGLKGDPIKGTKASVPKDATGRTK